VQQRPDVRASQALLHAASASIGVATANLFPQISLNGNYGWEAPAPSQLFGTTSKVWSITGQLLQPVFHGGALWASRRQAIDAYQQAEAQYKQTVLQSFQNVADSLRAIETDARALKANKAAEDAARQNFVLANKQYHLGGSSYLTLLNAQEQYVQTKLARIQAQAARFNDTAALFQALGGGWWQQTWCVHEEI
jgi:NodT family efflux transporter outer membrane factor (OMF) lipoprotein